MARSIALFLITTSLCACSHKGQDECPPQVAVAPEPVVAVTPAAVKPEPEPEPSQACSCPNEKVDKHARITGGDDDEPGVTRFQYNEFSISVRLGEREPDSADDDDDYDQENLGFIRIEAENSRTNGVVTIERPAIVDSCLVSYMEAEIDVIYSDEETVLLDVSSVCLVGETVMRMFREHWVVALDYTRDDGAVVYEGTSRVINNRGLIVDVDKREFYVEAGSLAVYRHSVRWCDNAGYKVLMGQKSGCRPSRRKLTLLKRVPI